MKLQDIRRLYTEQVASLAGTGLHPLPRYHERVAG